MKEIARLSESSTLYADALLMQRERLDLSRWMRARLAEGPPMSLSAIGAGGREQVIALCDAVDGIEIQLRARPSVSEKLDREMQRRRSDAAAEFEKLDAIRREIAALERSSDAVRETSLRYDRVERFRGRLEQALGLYDRVDQSSDLRAEISDLEARIRALQRDISQRDIDRRMKNALDTIQASCSRMIPQLDAE